MLWIINYPTNVGCDKNLVINLSSFPSTEIFSKRRKIYTLFEGERSYSYRRYVEIYLTPVPFPQVRNVSLWWEFDAFTP